MVQVHVITSGYRFSEKDVLDLFMLLTLRITTEGGQWSADREIIEGLPGNEEDQSSMGNLLLHHPLIQFYLLFVAALFVAFLWDYLRNPPAIQDRSRTPRNEMADGTPGFFPSAAGQNPVRSVSRPGRRTDKEVEPRRGGPRHQAPTAPIAAPNSRNRRKYHVFTP
jgi:hypothetical protein